MRWMQRRPLPVESELVPYAPGFPPGENWLVVAPHADDEVFGAGATIARATSQGVRVGAVVVTDGAAQGDAQRREREASAAAEVLGCAAPIFLRFPDRGVAATDRSLRHDLWQRIAEFAPDTLLLPSPIDLHPDHRAVALAVQSVLRIRTLWGIKRRGPRWVVAYEVGTPLQPNLLVDADETWDAKLRAAACYASQVAAWPYEGPLEGLAAFRSLTLPDVARAEAFRVFETAWLVRRSARAWAMSCGSIAALGG